MSTSEFHKLIHERFVELAGGSSPRTVATIVIRKDVLQNFTIHPIVPRQQGNDGGGKRVQPIEERVSLRWRNFEGRIGCNGAERRSEGEDSGNEGYSSEGDKFEKGMRQKKKEIERWKSEQECSGRGEWRAIEPEGRRPAKKKRHKPSTPKVGMKDILERQSGVLAGFLEKRADERSQEHERSRQEREADQKFWAAETAKDRALLRELFTSK
ncbi:hypothetical protein GQ600_3516 [Phytophthora cactorum]|nr:hypothetical protein GQ600_3516 [Phytophthora cactorum]